MFPLYYYMGAAHQMVTQKLQVFINSCLHLVGVFWPNTITNKELVLHRPDNHGHFDQKGHVAKDTLHIKEGQQLHYGL